VHCCRGCKWIHSTKGFTYAMVHKALHRNVRNTNHVNNPWKRMCSVQETRYYITLQIFDKLLYGIIITMIVYCIYIQDIFQKY